MATCPVQLNASISAFEELNATYTSLLQAYEAAIAPQPNPCDYETPVQYSQPFHVAAVFIVLVASALGAIIPLVGSHYSKYAVPPFVLVLGKCAGTGVVLACGFIHMLQPSNESLTNPCLSEAL